MARAARSVVRPDRPELFFALVRPTGCPSEEVVASLRAELGRVGYQLRPVIKLSALLHTLARFRGLRDFDGPEDDRIETHMDAGDQLREIFNDGGAIAHLAIRSIRDSRSRPSPNTAWILDSLKHTREVGVLRDLYGDSLVVISLYSDEDARLRLLARRITQSRGVSDGAMERARQLINRDEAGSESNSFGQDVRSTFSRADYFVSVTGDVRKQVGRMIETLFGCWTRSPHRDEYAMAVAKSAALRSADLSRQVGAVIVDREGEVLVAGCNEVPKFGGGVYWEGDDTDRRDFQLGYDPNEAASRDLLIELFKRLDEHEWLSPTAKAFDYATLARLAAEDHILERTRVTSLVEFGRIVHAEANAVLRAASYGIPINGMRMVCTTFPCHICARHLLGAGLTEVVYIEPYPKSLAPMQYPEAISVGEKESPGAMRFRPFVGWSPSRYFQIFAFGKRKDDSGYLRPWEPLQSLPRIQLASSGRLDVEEDLVAKTSALLKANNLLQSDPPAAKRRRKKRS